MKAHQWGPKLFFIEWKYMADISVIKKKRKKKLFQRKEVSFEQHEGEFLFLGELFL